jgi:phage baseplate assembly protein W
MIYNGFSTAQNAKKYTLSDYALARQDLVNYFSIRKGQKLMQATFGTIIWDMLFEPLDEATKSTIQQDINRIISYDPRLRATQAAVTQQENGFLIQISLIYVPTNQVDTLVMNFDRNSQSLTTN